MSSGGTILGDTIQIGGEIIVGAGGTASGLSLGNFSLAYSGTIALVVSSGATVVGGNVVSGTVYARAGATIQGLALGAGTTFDLDTTSVSSGQTLVEGATTSTRTISGVTLSSGAIFALETATVMSGGTLQLTGLAVQQVVVSAGGSVSGGTLFTSTAALSSLSSFIAGRLVGTTIDEAVVVQSGGIVSAATAGSAGSALTPVVGSVTVQSGGLVSGLTLLSATEYGGLDTPTSRGEIDARLTVQAGGSATNVMLTGGAAVVAAGGVVTQLTAGKGTLSLTENASGTVLGSQGMEAIFARGVDTGATVSSGGVQTISSGGTASAAVLASGGLQLIVAGGTATGTDITGGGTIDIEQMTYSSGGSTLFDPLTDTLTVIEGGSSDTLQLSGSYTGYTFALAQAADGSTLVTAAACYYPGTLILTNRGEMPVEILAISDTVVTASGKHRPVKWLGRRSYAGRFLAPTRTSNRSASAPDRSAAACLAAICWCPPSTPCSSTAC